MGYALENSPNLTRLAHVCPTYTNSLRPPTSDRTPHPTTRDASTPYDGSGDRGCGCDIGRHPENARLQAHYDRLFARGKRPRSQSLPAYETCGRDLQCRAQPAPACTSPSHALNRGADDCQCPKCIGFYGTFENAELTWTPEPRRLGSDAAEGNRGGAIVSRAASIVGNRASAICWARRDDG
jgi:hypothetical protein